MTHAVPWFSAFSAITELFVTAAIFYVLWMAVYRDEFKAGILGVALAYEVIVNISYMTSRLFTHTDTSHHADWMVALLAGHGILSLVMFLGLVALGGVAYVKHRREGRNLFAERVGLTGVFVVLWTISILSGEAIFFLEYIGHH